MANGIQEQSEIVLTPQEAEAILELWAQKQAEGELRSRLNLQDLAEAMSVPISEVEKMVATVRKSKLDQPSVRSDTKARPVNIPLIALAVVIWFSVIAGSAFLAFRAGKLSVVNPPMPPALAPEAVSDIGFAAPAGVEEAAIASEAASLSSQDRLAMILPLGTTAKFNGFTVEGSYPGAIGSESNISNGIKSFVRESSPTVLATQLDPNQKRIDLDVLLDPSGPKNSMVEFITLTIQSSGGRTLEAKLPIVRKTFPELERAAEVIRNDEIRRLSNQLVYESRPR